jgi:cell fate (sporulation/competence/biofilm development) regulator YlbF (YheA/YmcA/DUF963 family)
LKLSSRFIIIQIIAIRGMILENNIEHILEKAKDLARLVKKHRITKRYEEDLLLMRNDERSQQLLSKLVEMGKELNEKVSRGEEIAVEDSVENRILQEELESNNLVKSFIRSQREYLEFTQKIISRIRNPEEGS